MLFGNRESFAIEIRPLAPSWERRYLPERAAWAALSIWVGGENLCRHGTIGSDSVEDAVNVPLAPLADWIVRCWPNLALEERARVFPTGDDLFAALQRWGRVPAPHEVSEDEWIDAREEWWSHHFLSAGAEGAYLPNIALTRDDEKLVLQWARSRLPGSGPVFLAIEGLYRVQWDEGQETLADFVKSISDWLRREGLSGLDSESQNTVRMITGMREGGGAAAIILRSPRTSVRWGRRFEISRAVGHLLLDPVRSGSLGAAASNFSIGSRRRRSGAFAAEFLLPESALRAVSHGTLDHAAEPATFAQILGEFEVGARMAAYQLWNHGLLSSPEVRDDLIAEFGAQEFEAQ